MTPIDEIKNRINLVDLVSETVQLRKAGKNYTGFCPFHTNTRTPSFVVFPDTGTWRCFGQCNEGGDIFRYVMKKEGWDFAEALRRLAEKAGVQLRPVTEREQAAAEAGDHLRALLEEAVIFYRHHLLQTQAGKPVLAYLQQKRRLKDETIEAFGLGYAPLSWDAALTHFKGKGFSERDLLDAGLVSEKTTDGEEHSRVYDRFRRRIMLPIRDERGRMSGFGARVVDPADLPKFLNSPQTVLFDKGHLLYGLDRARKSIRQQEQVVIVEGYLDVIALHQAGYTNTVSPMGTALTEHQLFLLKRFTNRIVLALDPDAAGDKATLRGLQLARQTMDRQGDPVFDARGLLGFEARLQADIRVTTLPEGQDPDEVVNADPAGWQTILDAAKPIVAHVMDTLAAAYPLEDARAKTEVAGQVLPLIEELPNPIERDTYRQRLARLLRVDERALLGATPIQPRRAPRRRLDSQAAAPTTTAQSLSASANSSLALEKHCLGVLLRHPEMIDRLDRSLQQAGLARLGADDFSRAEQQTIFSLVQESLNQTGVEPLEFVLNRLPEPLGDAADDILSHTEKLNIREERVLQDLLRAILEIRMRSLLQRKDSLRFMMEEAQQQGDQKAVEYRESVAQYLLVQQRIHQALAQFSDRTQAAKTNA